MTKDINGFDYEYNENYYCLHNDSLESVESQLLQNISMLHNANVMLSRGISAGRGITDRDLLYEMRNNCKSIIELVKVANVIGIFSDSRCNRCEYGISEEESFDYDDNVYEEEDSSDMPDEEYEYDSDMERGNIK